MDKFMCGMIALLFVLIGADVYSTYSNVKKCEDAGGVYASSTACINPAAIIEVN